MLTNLSEVCLTAFKSGVFSYNRDFKSRCLTLSVNFVCYLVFLRGVSKIPGEFVLIVSVNKQHIKLFISKVV